MVRAKLFFEISGRLFLSCGRTMT